MKPGSEVKAKAARRTAIVALAVLSAIALNCRQSGPRETDLLFAFASDFQGTPDIYAYQGSDTVNLTQDEAVESELAMSADGTKIAFTSDQSGDPNIFSIRRDGSDRRQLTELDSVEGGAAWSPTGERIAFHSNRSGRFQIYVMQADGGDVEQLTFGAAAAKNPDWSPDGRTIVFQSDQTGIWDIFEMSADGTDARQLTAATGNNYSPSFSNDGSMLAFASDRDSNAEIYVMSSIGESQTRLTFDDGVDEDPTWNSIDESYIEFATNRAGEWDIYSITLSDRTAEPAIAYAGSNERSPARPRPTSMH